MASNDYIPADDAGLNEFALNFVTSITGSEVSFGLLAADSLALDLAQSNFDTALTSLISAQSAARAARVTKDSLRATLVTLLRSLTRRAQASPSTSDSDRSHLRITIADTTPTAIAAPTSQPSLFVDTSNRLMHTISFRDVLTPFSKAKPAGVSGCEIFRKIGAPAPVSLADCEFVANDSASPYLAEYDGSDAGKMVYYFGRWATRSGLTGPTSDLISATIVG